MKKEQREIIFNKYKGRCAYCGCELQKGWHVDEIEPIKRKFKYADPYWEHRITKEKITAKNDLAEKELWNYKYISTKLVGNGCVYPERLNIDNQNPACASCNINKHSGTLEEFREMIMGFMKHLNELNTQYKIAKRYGLVKEDIKPIVFYFETIKNDE